MKFATTLMLCLFAGPVMAANCDRWTASMEEDEGGPRMMASICTGTGDNQSTLLAQCGDDGELNLRFLPAPGIHYPPTTVVGNFEAELKFSLDQEKFQHKARLEEMDGAMAMYIAIKDPLFAAMKTHKTISLTDTDGKISAITFPLKGSKEALRKVIKTCGG